MTQNQRSKIIRDHLARHREHEKKAVRLIQKVFNKQKRILTIFVSKHGIAAGLSHLHSIVNQKDMTYALRKIWLSHTQEYVLINKINKNMGPKGSGTHQNYMLDYANGPRAADKVTKIDDVTRERIALTLKRAADNKLSKRDTAGLINSCTGFGDARSLLIARTETTMAANMGAFSAAKASGVELEKYWIDTDDNRTRPDHQAMHNSKPIPMDEDFIVGGEKMRFPGDPNASAKEICSCRCVVAFGIPKSVAVTVAPRRDAPGSHNETVPVASSSGHSAEHQANATREALMDLIERISAGDIGNGIIEGDQL